MMLFGRSDILGSQQRHNLGRDADDTWNRALAMVRPVTTRRELGNGTYRKQAGARRCQS